MQVSNAPAQGNIELEEFGQFGGGITCIGITPSTERNQQIVIFITKGAIYTSDKDVEVVQFIRGDFYAKLFKNTQTKFHNAMGIWGYELEIASHYWRFSNSIPDNLLDVV